MNQQDSALVLARGRLHQSNGRYDEAIADFMAVVGLSWAAPLTDWRRQSSVTSEAIEPLIRAVRELEISHIAIAEYLTAMQRPMSGYRGFASVDVALFASRDRTLAVAQAYLRRYAPARRREHLEMMLDIVENEAVGPSQGPTLLAYPHLRPIHARIRLITARQLLAEGKYQGARAHLEKALGIAPCYGPAYRLLGEALLGLGRGETAARSFDCAAAFWNPDWWSIEFSHGMRMRVPGIAVRGHDIFFWNDTFIAVKVSAGQRRLKQLTLTTLRYAHKGYGRWKRRARYRLRRADIKVLFDRIAGAVLRLPGVLWIWRRIRPAAFAARAGAGRLLRRGRRHLKGGLQRIRGVVLNRLQSLFPRRPAGDLKPRRTWRATLSLWLAELEIMWGAQSALRAASLQEMLDMLERVDA